MLRCFVLVEKASHQGGRLYTVRPMTNAPNIDQADQLRPDVIRVLAPNASPMTYWGTNSYVIGTQAVALIDPGPDDDAHRQALMAAAAGRPIQAILVTHSHVDHSPLATRMGQELGVPVYAYGDSAAGRSPIMVDLMRDGLTTGGEGVDPDFAPDHCLQDGETLRGDGWEIEAIHTPGHFGNHMCFALQDVLFCGDHVMDWASSLVSPPDGDLTDFMASCHKLLSRDWAVAYSAHGDAITDVAGRLQWLVDHRLQREAQILEHLAAPVDLQTLTERVYTDIAAYMLPAAQRNVFAHLVDLVQRDLVQADPVLSERAKFHRKNL